MLDANIIIIVVSSWWIVSLLYTDHFLHLATFFGFKSIFPDMSMEIPAFFWLLFASCIIFHAFASSLCLSLEPRSRGNMYLFFSPSSHSVSFDWWVQSIYIYDKDSTTIKFFFFLVMSSLFLLAFLLPFWFADFLKYFPQVPLMFCVSA